MRLYLDDDSASALLARLLRQAGHEVQLPTEVGMDREDDPVHPAHAIREDRVCLSGNHHDFENLHELILVARGHHPGILIVRKDNNPKRDLSESGIVKALGKLLASGAPIADQLHILNHWR
jgi:predicted nuclease of predicted toxin-antitoxin system